MKLRRLIFRNLLYYRRTNLAVVAGVATAVAALSGALLVGESVRDSLRSLLFERIGATGYVVSADRFFREDLAGELGSMPEGGSAASGCAIIQLKGVARLEATGASALDVNVYGVDERFWRFQGEPDRRPPEGRTALVGAALAGKLGAHPGDTLLLRVETQLGIPRESLFGRREDSGRTLRLVCGDVLPAENLGEFALRPSQGSVYSIFLPLRRLQRDLAQPSRANTILLPPATQGDRLAEIRVSLRKSVTLTDLGVSLRPLPTLRETSIECTRVILDDSVAQAAFAAAADAGAETSGVLTHLANSIRAGGREIPYSVITAADFGQGALTSIHPIEGLPLSTPSVDPGDSIWLNDWAWRNLGRLPPGEDVEIDYYVWEQEGRLATRTARFRLAGVVSIGGDLDASLAPDFPGITDARSMTAWEPPFPLDLRRIRPRDEEYWNLYRATPKAFIPLANGQKLWQSRFGRLSAVRVAFPEGTDPASARARLAETLRSRLNPESAGFSLNAVREAGLRSSRGSTDFGEYFVYFSFFLIAASILLLALFFRLGVEQRVREIGTLIAAGFSRSVLRRVFLAEGALLAAAGSLVGLFASVAYGWFLVHGLRTWWVGAVGTRRLHLQLSWTDLGTGAAAGVAASLLTVAWTLRGLRRTSPRALLEGVLDQVNARSARALTPAFVSSAAFLAAVALLLASSLGRVPDVAGFFGAGILLLVSILSLTALYLRRAGPGKVTPGRGALLRLGIRNATNRPGRSLLCIALIASATFIIVSMEAFRRDTGILELDKKAGTGGYPLLAQSALPIVYDLNSAAGREALGIPDGEFPSLALVRFVQFRLRPGDDVSCLNLYAPQEPRVLGAPHRFLADARFSFQDSEAATSEEKANPWLLLESGRQDGAIPAIGDADTIQYSLHLGLGREIELRRGAGAPVRLRLVGALRDSIFQGELLISEENFLRAFPEREGFRYFLLDTPPEGAAALTRVLEERLADWGFAAESTRHRLAAYHTVENTYLSTFQSLGALGLVLGTVGLATVLLRNVLERRKELALLRAVGYRRRTVSGIIVVENLALLTWGLAAGTLCALLSVLPAQIARGVPFPAGMVGLILVAVLASGLASSFLAVLAAIRSPLLEALHSE